MNVFRRSLFILSLLGTAIVLVQCKSDKKMDNTTVSSDKKGEVTIEKSEYGTTAKGEKVESYKLKNQNGMEVDIITFGGRITDLKVPNKEGISENVVIGFNSLAQYEKENPFFGALIGRFGNRIAKGKFSLDGKEYQMLYTVVRKDILM